MAVSRMPRAVAFVLGGVVGVGLYAALAPASRRARGLRGSRRAPRPRWRPWPRARRGATPAAPARERSADPLDRRRPAAHRSCLPSASCSTRPAPRSPRETRRAPSTASSDIGARSRRRSSPRSATRCGSRLSSRRAATTRRGPGRGVPEAFPRQPVLVGRRFGDRFDSGKADRSTAPRAPPGRGRRTEWRREGDARAHRELAGARSTRTIAAHVEPSNPAPDCRCSPNRWSAPSAKLPFRSYSRRAAVKGATAAGRRPSPRAFASARAARNAVVAAPAAPTAGRPPQRSSSASLRGRDQATLRNRRAAQEAQGRAASRGDPRAARNAGQGDAPS